MRHAILGSWMCCWAVVSSGCDGDEVVPGGEAAELDLAVEAALEADGADFECAARVEPASLVGDGEPAVAGEICGEWAEVDVLALPSPEPLTGVCHDWTETRWVVSGVACSSSGTWNIGQKRECSQCAPNPASCSGWVAYTMECAKG
ncbi:hypothetical protein OV079_34955 [Nannocystis pusilla]|uniref:Lipoprotein n=1 Tax=Nannocystis pusilla TaxID=889268 RepID=A0A9X3IZJ1_9BACT|nr:hypothetical protein [Nannocystis pusilla]MCY1010677.1 hypothetical protein [Nannocystis pusilla]